MFQHLDLLNYTASRTSAKLWIYTTLTYSSSKFEILSLHLEQINLSS